LVTITATWNGVSQSAGFDLIPPFGVSSVQLANASLFGLFGESPTPAGTFGRCRSSKGKYIPIIRKPRR
jgi:hypothetical protein